MTQSEPFEELVGRLTEGEQWEPFARRCGVSSRQLLNYRTKGSQRPHTVTVRAIAAALDVEPDVVAASIRASYDAHQKA